MFSISKALFPEMVLIGVSAILFLLGVSKTPAARQFAPILAVMALGIALLSQLGVLFHNGLAFGVTVSDPWQSIQITEFARYIKILTAAIGILLVFLAWPNGHNYTDGPAIHFGTECGEFFGLMLLSIAGVFLVAGANDIMLLFLGIELASLPTYIMVSISRPLPVAQEAGVKYFFLGAMSAAVMLFGFSYLYGSTGTIYLHGATDASGSVLTGIDTVMGAAMSHGGLTPWHKLALVLLIAGFAFKMAAVPLHVYAADVYQGAATPVTAFLSFIPKTSGFVALLKVLFAAGGGSWSVPPEIIKLIWWIAVLTMTFGNMLGLLQFNIKRVLAYSSIAHSGYMLAAVAALLSTTIPGVQQDALRGIIFYLGAYGLTNIAAFGVLILLPSREDKPATSAETFEDIAGLGRNHLMLGLAMAAACFSLIGIPLTIGFMGKYFLITPALEAHLTGLVVILVVNSAISAAYYLKIIANLFLRPTPAGAVHHRHRAAPRPVTAAIGLSVLGLLLMGTYPPLINRIANRAQGAAQLEVLPSVAPVTAVAAK